MKTRLWLAATFLIVMALAACGVSTTVPTTEPSSEPTAVPTRELTPPASSSLRVVRIAEMSVERAAHQATLLQTGEVLITGGCSEVGCSVVHESVELFDPAARSFRAGPPMSTPRAGHEAVVLRDGSVLVSGGWTGQQAAASAEIYDPGTGQWTAVGDMTVGRASHIAVLLADGRVLVMGGGSGGLGDLASAEVFDPDSSTFTAVGRMQTNHYLATALADGRVLVTGGHTAAGEILSSAEIFDPATNEFQPTGDMGVRRVKHAAALLADGRVLVIGGSDERSYSGRYASTEFYDPKTGSFSPGPDMQWGRHKIRDAVAVLPSGVVLVAGGALRPEALYPGQQAFVPVEGELSGPQMFATATLLPSGEVLILGGYDDRTRPSADAWLVQSN